MKHIRVKALHPVDIVVTKIGRLDDRDKQDIRACIGKFELTKTEVARVVVRQRCKWKGLTRTGKYARKK